MISYIAAFRSRSQTMRLFQVAKSRGIACSIITTPREASIGCGISLSYGQDSHAAVKNLVMRGDFNALIGFYKMERTPDGKLFVQRV